MRYLLLCLSLTGCALSYQLPDMEQTKLCAAFADFTFKGRSAHMLAVRDEILRRGLEDDGNCRVVYQTRMNALAPGRPAPLWEAVVARQ